MDKNSPSLFILTGAGISAESGLKTFRDNDGLWENHRVEEVATPEAFERDPVLVHRFYNLRRRQLLSDEVKPNAGHFALAELQKKWPGPFTLVTQNVDNLHEAAGSESVVHIHGELLKSRSLSTGEVFDCTDDLSVDGTPDLRPHIVWFGEMPLFMDEIYAAVEDADIFVAIGTSGAVYPAAGLVRQARRAKKYEVNLQKSDNHFEFDKIFLGPASTQVPLLADELLASLRG